MTITALPSIETKNTMPAQSSITSQVLIELNANRTSEAPAKHRRINENEKWIVIPLSILIRHDFMGSGLLNFESIDRVFAAVLKEKVHIAFGYISFRDDGEPIEKEWNILDANDYALSKELVFRLIKMCYRFGFFIHLRFKYSKKMFDSFAPDVSLMATYRKEETAITELISARETKSFKRRLH